MATLGGPPSCPFEDRFFISFDVEQDGRWIAEVAGLPGCLAYGKTFDEALDKVLELSTAILLSRHQGVSE